MDFFWSHFLHAPQFWLGVALAFLIAELITGTTYLLWPAVAAGVTALFAAMGVPIVLQVCLFALLTILLVLFARPIVRNRLLRKTDEPVLNNRAKALIGMRASAAQTFVDGIGAVKINDSIWRATSAEPIEAGASVQVLAVDGVTLRVAKA
ncbi:MAG TPA: NfeD family protein [Caulobacterales bacterium]|nr:NfeD family protein [Caulobacterales bacterium]